MDGASILHQFEAARSKLNALKELAALVADDSRANGSFIEDQQGRLRIWAQNIGVEASGHASLDHRLRDGPEAHRITVSILASLQDHAARAIELCKRNSGPQSTPEGWVSQIVESPQQDVSDAAATSTVASSFRGTETESLTEYLELEPYDQQLKAIEADIDLLYRLTLEIRRPSMVSHNEAIIRGRMQDEGGNESEAAFRQYVKTLLQHRLPAAKEFLIERMAMTITARRCRFDYRSRHQSKLAQGMPVGSTSGTRRRTGDDSEVQSTILGSKSTADQSGTAIRPARPSVRTSVSIISATSASKFHKNQFRVSKFESASVIATTAHVAHDHRSSVAVPDPPPLKRGAKEFECPYCFLMLSSEDATPVKWRRHVMADLEPYICPFPECTDEHMTIREFSSWMAHMQTSHTVQWSCTARQCRPYVVASQEEWAEHMQQVHADTFTEAQLPWLEKKARRPSPIILSSCPLCIYVPSIANLNNFVADSAEFARAQSDSLVKHLATHFEALSQIALPWQDDLRQPAEDDRLSSSQVERDSLKEEEAPESDSLSFRDEESDAIQIREDTLQEWIDTAHTPGNDGVDWSFETEDWSFLELEKHSYFGHDRDPTLQTFLQKMYLDVNPTTYNGKGPDLPAYLVPVTPVDHFFGRHYALQALSNALLPQTSGANPGAAPFTLPRTFAVYAPGGMGKTQLSAEFVSQNRDKFDAIFWVHADDYNKLAQGFQDIAVELGLVEDDSANAKDISFTREIVKKWLLNPLRDFRDAERPNPSRASWLLVFDGVESPDVLNDFWPYNGPGSVLITSRSPFSWSHSIQLAPFTEEEAVTFLLQLTEKDANDEQRKAVGKVNDQLGGLPLALAQMAGLIQHRKLSFAEFLESYNEQEELLRQSDSGQVVRASGYEHTLASVWAFENLAHGVPMLNVVSMLDPDGIPESLLTTIIGELKRSNLPTTYAEYATARNELVACSLLSRDIVERRFSIHRLVQDVARARMSPEEFRGNFMTCVDLISNAWPFEKFDWRHDVSKWTVCEPLFPHVSRLKTLYHEVRTSTAYSDDDYTFARLLTAAGWYHHERGRSSEAKIFNDLAEEICKSLQSRLQHSSEELISQHYRQLDRILAEIDHNRGCIATEVNEPSDALNYHMRFNSLMQKELGGIKGGQDMRLAISWNELGNAHMLNQNWADGQHCFEQSIALMKQLDNYEKILISLPVVNIGLAYWLQGRDQEALDLLLDGLKQREQVYGQEDREYRISFITGRYLHAIGNVHASLESLEDSQAFHHRALLHYKYTLGNNHHRTADTLVKVAEHHLRRRQDETALVLLEAANKIYSSSSENTYKPERARALWKMKEALEELDREEEAKRCLEVAFGLYGEVLESTALEGGGRVGAESAGSVVANTAIAAQSQKSSRRERRKSKAQDLRYEDLLDLVAFWSR